MVCPFFFRKRMITVLVEHFLSPEGKEHFPDWLNKVKMKLAHFEGFISLQQVWDVEDRERILLELKFSTLNQLKKWASSSEHNAMIDVIKPFQIQKQRSQIFSDKKSVK